MLSSDYQQVPSRRTDQIIGRKQPLKSIYEAIKDNEHTWLLYFYGSGGVGKTRLLEEIGLKNGKWEKVSFRCTRILDLYHSDYQSSDGIRQSIVLDLDNERNYLEEYHAKRQELVQKQKDGVSDLRLEKEVEAAFLDGYRKLAQDHRLVICLDTLELMQHENDSVQEICRVETVDAVVMNWLIGQLPALPNTVILMAGRPENKTQIEETFSRQFRGASHLFAAQLLEPFIQEETTAYLQAIAKKLESNGSPDLVEVLQEYDHLDREFHRVTKGRPVYLALIIDLFLAKTESGERFVNDILAGREFSEEEMAKQLIENLQKLPEMYGRVIQYLLAARKGLDADLLKHFGEDESGEIGTFLHWLAQLAIVKVRTTGKGKDETKTYFFHDEIYNMHDQYFKADAREAAKYQPFVEYYRQKPETSVVDRLFYEMQVNPYEGYHLHYARWDHDAIHSHKNDFDMRLRNEVLGFLNRYVNPDSDFYDEFIARQLDKNTVKIPQNGKPGTAGRQKVDRDCAVRWVRRHWARGDSKTAREVALNLITSTDPLFDWKSIDDDFYKADLLNALEEAAIQEAATAEVAKALNKIAALNVNDAADILKQAIAMMEKRGEKSLDAAQQWHYDRILGAAHNRLGYLYRTAGRYGLALRHYRPALGHFDKAHVESELALVLTNTAFLLGLNSRTTEALRLINRAIDLNEMAQRHYPLALAVNTKGIIYTLDDHPNWGVNYCKDALAVVKQVGDARGVGLALNGLGFSLRKQANQWKFGGISNKEAGSIFQEAKPVFDEAIKIFRQFSEPLRLWEAYNEMGSLHCDWGWLARSGKNGQGEALDYYKEAISYQNNALSVAMDTHLEANYLDSLDDLAQVFGDRSILHFILGNPEKAMQDRIQALEFLETIENRIETEFKLTPGLGFVKDLEQREMETKWLALGKLHLWRGVWKFRDVMEINRITDDVKKEQALEDAIENLFVSSIYFRRYWVTSFDYERPIGLLTDFLPRTGKNQEWARARVEAVETRYNIQLPELHDLVRQILYY